MQSALRCKSESNKVDMWSERQNGIDGIVPFWIECHFDVDMESVKLLKAD